MLAPPAHFTWILRKDLAGANYSMAEACLLAVEESSAEQVSNEAVTLLSKLVREQPENSEAPRRTTLTHYMHAERLL